jgi:hypothetical protein
MRATEWSRLALVTAAVVVAAGSTGCKTVSERYIALEVWKYEKCFGHLPPGFVPPGAAVAPAASAMRPCGQPSNCCESTPCPSAPGEHVAGCNDCQGGIVAGGAPMGSGIPVGGTVVPGLPAGPGGAPGPMPSGSQVTTSKPVVISDEVVLP